MLRKVLVVSAVLFLRASTHLVADPPPPQISFNRDIRPIMSRNCFPCHGPDASSREADLRLDQRQVAIDSGSIDLDDLASSPILERVHSVDPDSVMPPPESGKTLSTEQKQLLSTWIHSGARYETHWAFVPPVQSAVPHRQPDTWALTNSDRFLRSSMQRAELSPRPPADRYTLVRRLYQDLLGLIPTPSQADAFVEDESPNAYEKLVDRLLASPQYGEHMARSWLDLARYSDTNGYEKDRPRSIWPYRDWVIQAISEDMPFDQFTIEQLAGDMLPNASVSQRIATGFHRNTMLNEEGGIDPLEYRFYAMVDRVATTGTVWMGMTVGCAQCHTHKYDPISHTDYYRMLALLNNADEPDLRFRSAHAKDVNQIGRDVQQMEAELVDRIEAGELAKAFGKWKEMQASHAAVWLTAKPTDLRSNLPRLERMPDNSVFASGDFTKRDEYFMQLELPADVGQGEVITAIRLDAIPDDRLPASGPGRTFYEGRKGQFFLSEVEFNANGASIEPSSASYSHSKERFSTDRVLLDGDGSTGWSNGGQAGERHTAVIHLEKPIAARSLDVRLLFERHFVASLGRFKFSVTTASNARALRIAPEAERILASAEANWSPEEQRRVSLEFLRTSAAAAEWRKPIEELEKQQQARSETLVMQERSAGDSRTTHRHHRGEWLSPREPVTGNVPAAFPSLPPEQANRLGFARWLVSPDNPLFARVVVNRAWRHFMGAGFVRSDGDFGTQSSPPTHPELLDWLACEFVEQGMSRKWLHRQIVLGAAYRQQSHAPVEQLEQDPLNRYFARGPRHRVNGETIRDMMLQAGEQLSGKIGGPSVRPPQPSSVTQVAYGNPKWNASSGEDRFRRSLYTFSKRTAPFAAFTTFDGPSGETCVARRNRSNTPLQALTLLNDEMFVELSRHIGRAAYRERAETEQSSVWLIERVFRRLLTRSPRAEELQVLQDYHAKQLRRLEAGELSAASIGDDDATSPELAALMMVARVIMNLDEMVTKN